MLEDGPYVHERRAFVIERMRNSESRCLAVIGFYDAAKLLFAAYGAMELRLECFVEHIVGHLNSSVRA